MKKLSRQESGSKRVRSLSKMQVDRSFNSEKSITVVLISDMCEDLSVLNEELSLTDLRITC